MLSIVEGVAGMADILQTGFLEGTGRLAEA